MHKGIPAFVLALGLFTVQSAAASNINFFLGSKGLDEDDWLADAHGELGLLIDIGGPDWPVNIAIDMLSSYGDFDGLVYDYQVDDVYYYEEEVRTREFDVGVRKYWDVGGNMYPYFGGGIAFVELEAEGRPEGGIPYKDEGSGTGIWLGGGVQWRFNQFNVGFSVRASGAEVDLDNGHYEGGGGHAGLLLGFNF